MSVVCVYDAECPVCRSAVAAGRRLDRRGEVRWVPSQDAAALRAAGVPDDPRADRTVLVWDGGGEALTESAAVAALVRRTPVVGPPLAALLRLTRPLADRIYRFVASHRHHLARIPPVRRR